MSLLTRRTRPAVHRGTQRSLRARLLLAAGAVALMACSPTDIRTWMSKTGRTTTVTVQAKAGPNDGGGRDFRAATVCDGEGFWRRGPWKNVDAPTDDGTYESTVQCFDDRVPVVISWERQ